MRFLQDASATKAKFLLTSRRDEHEWLGEHFAARVQVPAMPMRERLQLSNALAERRGKRLRALPDLRLLLEFTAGNPLTILVTVGQALREGIATSDRLKRYVDQLRLGTQEFDDEQSEGRSRSLGASLSYGFAHAFDEADLRHLAMLHLFQGFVDVDVFRRIRFAGEAESPRGEGVMDRDAALVLLERALEVGVLTSRDSGYYSIHPALPWFLRALFERYYPNSSEAALRVQKAFATAMGMLGDYYHNRYNDQGRDLLGRDARRRGAKLDGSFQPGRRKWVVGRDPLRDAGPANAL